MMDGTENRFGVCGGEECDVFGGGTLVLSGACGWSK